MVRTPLGTGLAGLSLMIERSRTESWSGHRQRPSFRRAGRGESPSPHEHCGYPRCCFPLEDATFGGLFGCFRAPCPRRLPNSRIPCKNEFAGAHRRFLEILSIGRKDLPARHLLPQHLNGSHVGELPPQTLVMLLGGGEPHSVVGRLVRLVAEDEDDFVLNVEGEASEHRTGRR